MGTHIKEQKKARKKEPVELKTVKDEECIVPDSKKNFLYYWNIIEIPVYIMILWSVTSVLIQVYGTPILNNILAWFGWTISVGAFSYIGYYIVEKKKEGIGCAAKAGATAGIIVGFFGGIMNVVSYYKFHSIFQSGIDKAIEAGAAPEMAETFTRIGVYASVVFGPLVTALIGAGLAALVAWFVQRKVFG